MAASISVLHVGSAAPALASDTDFGRCIWRHCDTLDQAQAAIAEAARRGTAALIWQAIPDLNWAGFYRFDGTELVLGPFQGKAACIRIPLDKGVCGAAARLRETQRVEDVFAFPGHIACDAASRSELVIPIVVDGRLIGVLDLDSPSPGRFSAEDQRGAETLVARTAAALVG